jgi:hypothetical protein
MRDSIDKSRSIDTTRASVGSKYGRMPWSGEVKVPTEHILLGESPFKVEAALKCKLVTCAERPAMDFSPVEDPEHSPRFPIFTSLYRQGSGNCCFRQ